MIKRLFCGFLFLMICSSGFPQFNKTYSRDLSFKWFNCDSRKNIYTVSGSVFFKYSPPYVTSITYTLPKEETPDFIDTNNPNQIVLFFQGSRRVILLDSMFHEIARPFYLEELGMYEISMIFSSNDGGLWFYNYLQNSLIKLNKNFLPVIKPVSLNPYFQAPNCPNYISILEDKIYINVPSNGILVLGKNGEYLTAIQPRGLVDFQVDSKIVYFYRDGIIYCFNYKTLKTKKIYIPDEPNILNAWFYEKQIIVLKKDGFSVYQHEIEPSDNNYK